MFSIIEGCDVGLEEGSLLCKLYVYYYYVYGFQGSIKNFRENILNGYGEVFFLIYMKGFLCRFYEYKILFLSG